MMGLGENRCTLAARSARFHREQQRPPPPLPTNRIAHSGGKIVTSDKDRAFRKLLERKAKAGEPLTADQMRVLSSLGAAGANASEPRATSQPQKAATAGRSVKKPSDANAGRPKGETKPPSDDKAETGRGFQDWAAERKLRKKIRECEGLEAQQAAGAKLEANQLAKMSGKTALMEELERLTAQLAL